MENPETLTSAQREIEAMSEVAKALNGLQPDSLKRVLDWTVSRYIVSTSAPTNVDAAHIPSLQRGILEPETADFPTLLGSANAQTGLDRALLVGYFLQVVQGNSDFDAFSANRELRHAGHVSGNITRDLDSLQGRNPQLIIQTRKHGNTKQARKLYKLTSAGIAEARTLLGR